MSDLCPIDHQPCGSEGCLPGCAVERALDARSAPPDVVDINGVAAILGVSRQHAYKLKAAGKLPPSTRLTVGDAWWRHDIEELARERANG